LAEYTVDLPTAEWRHRGATSELNNAPSLKDVSLGERLIDSEKTNGKPPMLKVKKRKFQNKESSYFLCRKT
jgi:hypothetical protein